MGGNYFFVNDPSEYYPTKQWIKFIWNNIFYLFFFCVCVMFGLSTHKLIWVYLVFPFCNKLGSFIKFLLQLIFLLKLSENLLFSYDFKENRDKIMKSFWTQGFHAIGIISEWKGCRKIRFSVRNVINVRNREPEVAIITDLIMVVSHFCILLFFSIGET